MWTGFLASTGEIAVPVMANRSDDLAVIPRVVAEIGAAADVVAACGCMAGDGIVGDTIRQRLSRL